MKRWTICDDAGNALLIASSPDDSIHPTSRGPVRTDQLVADTKASATISGPTGPGDVVYQARYGGPGGNGLTVSHATGSTGPGAENRALAVVVPGGTAVTVRFGTDGAGNSVTPTAGAVEAVVNADPIANLLVSASVTGDVAVGLAGDTPLTGGVRDGTLLRQPDGFKTIALIETV
jgi:hypothetical protein